MKDTVTHDLHVTTGGVCDKKGVSRMVDHPLYLLIYPLNVYSPQDTFRLLSSETPSFL